MHQIAFPLIMTCLAVCALSAAVPTTRAAEIGTAVGPVNLTTLSGERLVMNNYGQRPVTAVLFLSSRCDATARVLAEINALYGKYRLRNVLFVGVCSKAAESGDELRDFAQRRGMIFPVYRDPDGAIARQFGATATPELYLLDRQGNLAFHGGLQDAAARQAVESAIQSSVAAKPVAAASHAVEGTPLAEPGPKRAIDDPYGAPAFESQLVFEKIPFAAAHHCSTICEAANGDRLCLWYGGSYESADDQVLFLARRKPADRNWSTPQVLARNALQPPGNGVIFRDAEDLIWIVWGRMEGTRPMRRGSGWDRCRLMVRTSTDHGATWSDDRAMFEETLWCVPRNPPLRMADGSLLLPVEGELDGVEGSRFLTLAPGTATWRPAGFTPGGSQPAVIQRQDGSLLALMRHSRFITQIESRDAGQTWTKAVPTTVKNPDAGITMTRLANGHLVLVFNDSQTARTPLSIARSVDEGQTWETPLHLESNPGEYSYPCVIQSADGRIHISYTFRRYAIKHVELNEDWLVHLERSD
ncbi:MAG: exo-alpha-sialidase [Pirellulales bacterium]